MNEAYTLEKLFRKFPGGICVPRIQRGYVQGREDAKGENIRKEFVPVLVNAVFGNVPMSIDFLYGVTDGSNEKRCLLPLDGQQRLTTLALLAWLCGKWQKKWRFDYEARRIPQLFMEGLLGDVPPANGKPSEVVRVSGWFLPVWENDPSVAGMLNMLDALKSEIGSHDCAKANLGNITFLLHGINGTGDTFDHIFRKMNARGKELTPWENLKAMLDKHVPRELAEVWRDKIDGDWAECIWKGVGRDIVNLDNALEKVVRMAYVRVAGFDKQEETLWQMDSKLSSEGGDVFSKKDISKFFQFAAAYFNALGRIANWWTTDRTKNALWDTNADVAGFWKWIGDGNPASSSNLLRMAFLAEAPHCPDDSRRRRILLNLLDASSIENKFEGALKAGLDFLADKLDVDGLEARKVGYSPAQLEDERRKWKLNADHVIKFEKDPLVYRGSLRFIGWSDFVDEADVKARLQKVRSAIEKNWIGFYCNLAARLPITKRFICFPVVDGQYDSKYWREEILSDSDFIDVVKEWNNLVSMPQEPAWVTQLRGLFTKGMVKKPNLRRYCDDDWVYLLNTDSNRSANSLRLDYNETERKNRALLKWDDAVGYWGEPWPWKQAKEPDIWFNVNDDSWLSSCAPNRFMRNSNGEFVPVVGAP